jgi:DNA endonuclease
MVDELYSKTLELAKEGQGPSGIARQLHDFYSLRISPGTLRHWIVGDREPKRNTQHKNIFKHEPSPELSYIIGANIGDGCTLTKGWCVKLEVTDLDFATTFNASMAYLFSRASPNKILTRNGVGRLPMHVVKYSSKQLTRLLRMPMTKLLELAFAFPREFLRGFFDAEGHVDVKVSVQGFHVCAGVENSNIRLLQRIKHVLFTVWQIHSNINRKRLAGSLKMIRGKTFRMRKTSFTLLINKLDDLGKFARQIGFSIKRKEQKLEDAFSIIARHEPKDRAEKWAQDYFKLRGEWVKRQFHDSNESKVLR